MGGPEGSDLLDARLAPVVQYACGEVVSASEGYHGRIKSTHSLLDNSSHRGSPSDQGSHSEAENEVNLLNADCDRIRA